MEIPEAPETIGPFFIVTATWTGRGRVKGCRKAFPRLHVTLPAAEKAAAALRKEWRKRRIYKLQ